VSGVRRWRRAWSGDEKRLGVESVKEWRTDALAVMGRRSGLRARCSQRCSTWWLTCKCHHTAVDTCRTCAAVCRSSRRTLTICCTKTYLVALNFMFLVRSTQWLNWRGGSRRISDPAPLIRDPLPLITDPVPHNWDPAPFCWDPPLCWVESKHQTLFKCHKSQTECLECSKTPGRRSGTPPLLSALRVRASALKASRL